MPCPRRRMHRDEFAALVLAYVNLFTATVKHDAARSWMNMLKQAESDHPQVQRAERMGFI
jgi:hypothetical protein